MRIVKKIFQVLVPLVIYLIKRDNKNKSKSDHITLARVIFNNVISDYEEKKNATY